MTGEHVSYILSGLSDVFLFVCFSRSVCGRVPGS